MQPQQPEISEEMDTVENPWDIQSIYEWQFFNCSDLNCDFKCHLKQDLLNHLYDNHIEGLLALKNVTDDSLSDVTNPWGDSDKKDKGGRPTIPLLESTPKSQKAKLNPYFQGLKQLWRKRMGHSQVYGTIRCNQVHQSCRRHLIAENSGDYFHDPLTGSTIAIPSTKHRAKSLFE